jgi:hypothetical protein
VIAPPPPFAFNAPVFNLYTSNLSGIEAWTRANMGARPGICVPETMRFNGNGYQNPGSDSDHRSLCRNAGQAWEHRRIPAAD